MRIRGEHQVTQIERTLNEEDVRIAAIQNIANQFGQSIMAQFGARLVKEEGNERIPYGRYYLDIDVEAVDATTSELGGDVFGVSTIGG